MHELPELLTNWAHWAFHLIADLITGLILYPAVRWLIKRHDRVVHGSAKHRAKRKDKVDLVSRVPFKGSGSHNLKSDPLKRKMNT